MEKERLETWFHHYTIIVIVMAMVMVLWIGGTSLMGTAQRRDSEKEIEQIRMILGKQVSELQATVKSATPEFRYLTDDYIKAVCPHRFSPGNSTRTKRTNCFTQGRNNLPQKIERRIIMVGTQEVIVSAAVSLVFGASAG